MSPEMETLDQLLCEPLTLEVVRKLYPDPRRFTAGILAMLESRDIAMLDTAGQPIPTWDRHRHLGDVTSDIRLAITDRGIKRIE
ncbi:hypothetical protein SAMN06265222_12517 [Neorhodopirellula lusitana]|uniref:Uncharacterized protein n=1 Tax=Neorhodopirellula lusitana TaxID=445327 RepID=A0ABY1QQP4_9BACT|nr:hypothetical protein SAMN06265222_12517 [Neorhodopirellula lusitana]